MATPSQTHELIVEQGIVPGDRVEDFLVSTGLMEQQGDDIEMSTITAWERKGAETYTTHFRLSKGSESIDLIAKACVKFAPSATLNEWLERRRLLEENGVIFPRLFFVQDATLVEEYIPFTLYEAYGGSDADQKQLLREQFFNTYKRIVGQGFSPTSLHDVRSHGNDVVMIDVGEDLGSNMPITSCDLSVVLDAERAFRGIVSER